MYQFRTGIMYSNSLTAHEALVAGGPVSLNSDGELAVTADAAATDGIVTTSSSAGDYVGLQTAGFCGTNQVVGTVAAGGPIVFADSLEVASGKLVKKAAGVAVAKSWGNCAVDISALTTTLLDIEIL